MTNFRLFHTVKGFADDNSKFYENDRNFSKQVENIVEKGEIACYFSFSHSVFKRLAVQTRKNQGLFGKGLNTLQYFFGGGEGISDN